MLSYVILVSIALTLSVAVFAWLKTMSNVSPISDCNEGTSVILENSSCNGAQISLLIKNNGLFNVSGVLVSFGNDTKKIPVTYLPPSNMGPDGFYILVPELSPGDQRQIKFDRGSSTFKFIRMIQIQPFIFSNKKKVFCSESIIKQEIPDCQINP